MKNILDFLYSPKVVYILGPALNTIMAFVVFRVVRVYAKEAKNKLWFFLKSIAIIAIITCVAFDQELKHNDLFLKEFILFSMSVVYGSDSGFKKKTVKNSNETYSYGLPDIKNKR